jgi:hypothetical protein
VSDYSVCCDIDAQGHEGKLALVSLVNAPASIRPKYSIH